MSNDLLDDDSDFAILAGMGILIPVIVSVLIGTGVFRGDLPETRPLEGSPIGTSSSIPSTTTTLPPTKAETIPTDPTTSTATPLPSAGLIEARLADAGFPTLEIEIAGREATVTGSLADETLRSTAISIVLGSPGVEQVVDDVLVGG